MRAVPRKPRLGRLARTRRSERPDTRRSVQSRSTIRSIRPAGTPLFARSNGTRSGRVIGTPLSSVIWSSANLRARCTIRRPSPRRFVFRRTVTWTGSTSVPGTPQRAAAEWWLSTAPDPAESTATIARWSSVSGAPRSRKTPVPARIQRSFRSSFRAAERLGASATACRRSITPC